MDKEHIFKSAKEDLIQIINDVQEETIKKDAQNIRKYLDFLETLVELQGPKRIEQLEEDADNGAPTPETHLEPLERGCTFERKLKGGFLTDLNIYVPETVVRKLDLQSGDIVEATPKESMGREQHYHFTLINKCSEPIHDKREVFNFCKVDKDGSMWVCNEFQDGKLIKWNEVPFTVRLRDSDVSELDIQQGDIIDIAFYIDKPEVSRIVWKHRTDAEIHTTPLPSSAYKERSFDVTEKQKNLSDLAGRAITLIGNIDHKASYREAFNSAGATFDIMDGNEDKHRLSSAVRRSELVIIIIPNVGHHGAEMAKKYCKENRVPFKTTDTMGTSSILKLAVDWATENEKYSA